MHVIKIMNLDFSVACAEREERRLDDLAAALDARLNGFSGDVDGLRRLVLTALALMDEAQTTSAALARARCEIERLTDMVVEAQATASDTPDRSGVSSLRVAHGVA